MPRELNDIVEGYNNKIKRENAVLMYHSRLQRRTAFISILPHIKPGSLTEEKFNNEMWFTIDEEKTENNPDAEKESIRKKQEFVRQYQLKLSEQRRLKAQQKNK